MSRSHSVHISPIASSLDNQFDQFLRLIHHLFFI